MIYNNIITGIKSHAPRFKLCFCKNSHRSIATLWHNWRTNKQTNTQKPTNQQQKLVGINKIFYFRSYQQRCCITTGSMGWERRACYFSFGYFWYSRVYRSLDPKWYHTIHWKRTRTSSTTSSVTWYTTLWYCWCLYWTASLICLRGTRRINLRR